MTSSYTIVINNHSVQCDSAESVIALLKAAGGAKTSVPTAASTSTAAPVKTRRRRGPNKARKAANTAMAAAPAAKPAKAAKAAKKGGKRTFKKSAGLSKRSVAFLNEFSRSGGSTLTAERLAKATGAKGAKGVGGSLTALARELKSFGYDINAIVSRKKTLEDGTTWSANTGASGLVNEILGKVPVVA